MDTLGGYVKRSDGSPAPQVPILIANDEGTWFTTMTSDAGGYFHQEMLSSGKHVIGVNLPRTPSWKPAGCAGNPERARFRRHP